MSRPRLFAERCDLHLYLDRETYEYIQERAKARGISPSSYMRWLINMERSRVKKEA